MAMNEEEFRNNYSSKHCDVDEAWCRVQGMLFSEERTPKKEIVWNDDDILQVKGLAFLGKNSKAWNKAPEVLRIKADELLATGWEPKF